MNHWVPSTCRQLRYALKKCGITKVNGRPLSKVKKRQLYAVWYRQWQT